jgi:hypothetical protein
MNKIEWFQKALMNYAELLQEWWRLRSDQANEDRMREIEDQCLEIYMDVQHNCTPAGIDEFDRMANKLRVEMNLRHLVEWAESVTENDLRQWFE